jgi:uncharacterized membrane protein (DUF2068 family)
MEQRREGLVLAIGVFKLVKAALLVSVAVAMLLGLPQQIARHAEHAFLWLGIFPGRRLLHGLIERLWGLDASIEKRLAAFSIGYAAVFTVEGVGLVLRRRWAEWLTVFVTGSFIPIEVYELVRHFGPGKIVALVLNVAVVAYLAWRRVRDRRAGRTSSPGDREKAPPWGHRSEASRAR